MSGSTVVHFDSVEEMDLELGRLARASGALRFELGRGLEALARTGGHHELGFSSLEAYALERCERSTRWVQESRGLARRLEELPAVRSALVSGKVSFSMAQVVAKVARAEDEAEWLAKAQGHSVREMRRLVRQQSEPRLNAQRSSDVCDAASESDDARLSDGGPSTTDEELATLTVTVDREDAWLFEGAGMMVKQLGGITVEEALEALLAEGTTSLLALVRRDGLASVNESEGELAQRQWEAELSRWREEAEARSEARFRTGAGAGADRSFAETCALELEFEGDAAAIDAELRRIAAQLSRRDLALGKLAEGFWKADGWRRRGFATASQYARERLGMSLSSIKAKRRLARCTEKMPRLATALASGEVGYEAARLVAAAAAPETVDEWIARAGERTVRHLREEVDAWQMFARLAPGSMTQPPSEEIMQELAALEGRIASGELFRKAAAGQMSAPSDEPRRGFGHAQRRSRAARHSGRVTLRFRVSAETCRYYRWLERLFERHGTARVSFMRFLCCALIEAWQNTFGATEKYGESYGRDRYRCTSPVCGRRDVTPHHLKFRSAGGDDSPENLASLCVWCHLQGIHGGRLRAEPPASNIEWHIGRTGHTVVFGRRRAIRAEDSYPTETYDGPSLQ